MKKLFFLGVALPISACLCGATTLTVGSPNYNNTAGNILSPRFGTYISFDNLTPNTPLAANAYASMGVLSITSNNSSDPLWAYPDSSQSAPNYVSTQDSLGGLTITLSNTVATIGIGVLAGDGNPETLTALGATGNVLGTFSEIVPINGNTPFNAYYVIADTSADIKSLVISSAAGFFGVDDLQVATPEPMNLALVAGGALLVGLSMLCKKARSQP